MVRSPESRVAIGFAPISLWNQDPSLGFAAWQMHWHTGSYGVYYAGYTLATAIAETRYHRARFLALTREDPIGLDMRTYLADLDGELHDIRGRDDLADVYDWKSYAAGQTPARALKAINSYGIAYDSVRHAGGECVAVFRPPALSNCIQGPHFGYVWDGEQITTVYGKKLYANYCQRATRNARSCADDR